jgi:hypothetical protein
MSTRKLNGVKDDRPARKADNLTAIREPIVSKKCERFDVSHPCASTVVIGMVFTFIPGHLRDDHLENVGASTSHNLTGLRDLLQWYLYLLHRLRS